MRQIPTIRLIYAWKSWIWGQYLPESMKWKFGESLILWNQWTFETKKPRNHETKKPRNQETNNQETKKPRNHKPRNQTPRNQETKNTINFSSKGIPNTPQHPLGCSLINSNNWMHFPWFLRFANNISRYLVKFGVTVWSNNIIFRTICSDPFPCSMFCAQGKWCRFLEESLRTSCCFTGLRYEGQ